MNKTRHRTYKRNIEEPSRNYCYCGKAISITYFELCVCSPGYPTYNAHAPYYIVVCDVSCCTIFFHISHKRHDFLNKEFIYSFSSLSYDRSKSSSKASSPHSAIQSFLFQMRVSSPFFKVI
jgi:hypothetical protein